MYIRLFAIALLLYGFLCAVNHQTFAIVLYIALIFLYYYFRLPPAPTSNHCLRVLANGGVIAHRAGAYDAPENTLAAIRLASHRGATAVEVDVAFTKDGIPVLLHDDSVDRTTNGYGAINQLTLEQISQLDASTAHRLHEQFKGEKIPTLEQAIIDCKKLDLMMFLDIKGEASRSPTLVKLLAAHDMFDHVLLGCFWPHTLYTLRRLNPRLCIAFTYRQGICSTLLDGSSRYTLSHMRLFTYIADKILDWCSYGLFPHYLGCSALLIYKKEISQRLIERCRSFHKVQLIAWTVNRLVDKAWMTIYRIPYMTDITYTTEECDEQVN